MKTNRIRLRPMRIILAFLISLILTAGCGGAGDVFGVGPEEHGAADGSTLEAADEDAWEACEDAAACGNTPGILDENVWEEPFESAWEAVANMSFGWNMGNALDSMRFTTLGEPAEWETAWGSSVITPELIAEIKAAGFRVVRLPVSWQEHMDENGRVSEEWMNRVEEIVNDILKEDLYCILNVHHDCGAGNEAWLKADAEQLTTIAERYVTLWTQIAARFQDYGEKLIFEGYNELLDEDNHWTSTDEDGYRAANEIAQIFVDTVRATGGHNSGRNLIVNTYSADAGERSAGALVLPEDPAEGHLIVGVHIYAPDRFTTSGDWITNPTSEFDEAGCGELDEIFARLDRYFISRGIPVVVGEFGAQDKENDGQRALYANYVVRTAGAYNIPCLWWDDCGSMALIDRESLLWTQPEIRDALLMGAEGKEISETERAMEEAQ